MMTTEDVLVSVRGFHTTVEGGDDEIEVFSPGKHFLKGGSHYILYDEMIDGTGEIIKNRIVVRGQCMVVKKIGAVTSHMQFEPGKKNTAWYQTAMGNLLTGVIVKEMSIRDQEDLLEVNVDYELEINYEHVADCKIAVKVMPKDSGQFQLC